VEGYPTYCSLRAVSRQVLAWRYSINNSRKAFSFCPEEQGLLSVIVLSYSFTLDLCYCPGKQNWDVCTGSSAAHICNVGTEHGLLALFSETLFSPPFPQGSRVLLVGF